MSRSPIPEIPTVRPARNPVAMSPIPPTTTPSPLFLRRLSRSRETPMTYREIGSEVSEENSQQTTTKLPLSPKRLSICGFLPLPVITASPICTPTPSSSSRNLSDAFDASGDSEASPVSFPPSTPTWIATPPTPPPPKALRRSNTSWSTRHSRFTPVSPSASFPASMQHPHANSAANALKALRRCSSVPAFSPEFAHLLPTFFLSFMDAPNVESLLAIADAADQNAFDATYVGNGDVGPTRAPKRDEHSGPVPLPVRIDKDDTDGVASCENSNPDSRDDPSLDGSWSDHSIEDIWEIERNKDALRRFHALKELLSTEVGYLMDLRFLVTVYLRHVPTLVARSMAGSSTFGRASSSFATGPWIPSHTQLQATSAPTSAAPAETQNVSVSSSSSTKESSKSNSRYLFSDHEVEILTRNAEELLQLHEHFVRELRVILEPLGFTMEHDEEDHGDQHLVNLDAAIRVVSAKFATEASRFNAYQTFCAGHPEAIDVLRKAFQHFPLELEAFEQRSATMVTDLLESDIKPALSEPPFKASRSSTDTPSSHALTLNVDIEDRKRAMSFDGAVKTLRPRSSHMIAKDSVAFPTEPSAKRDRSSRRIAFMDYTIKPVQRICKYPLLLDQLLPSKALRTLSSAGSDARSDVDVVVESAAQAMRHVATSVDDARHRQDIAIQSGLIFSRICHGLQTMSSSNSPSCQAITSEFLTSLGDCMLSGSLDVMHYHPDQPLGQTSNIKAKYLGAFLYTGGYLILVKVSKGKKYEPKHWFSLMDFEISDVQDDSAMLPCSIRLSCGDQHFELAAGCQREKEAWLSSMREALRHVPAWTSQPTPSFKFDSKGELLPDLSDDGHSEPPPSAGLPTIRSIPELGNGSDTEASEPFFASLRGHGKSSKKKRRGYETPSASATLSFRQQYDMPPPPSRRSSSTSVKNIFGPMAASADSETVVITRSSPVARHQVDQELQDVISQSCLTARTHAFSHEMELFQAPTRAARSSRTNSGMGSMGMARLSKHESVRVPRRRTAESLDGHSTQGVSPQSNSTSSRRKNIKKLSLASISFDYEAAAPLQEFTPSPCPSPPSSQSSSSQVTTLRNSVEVDLSNLPVTPHSASFETKSLSSKQPRSFVRNVKGFFHFHPVSPASPVSVIVSQPSQNSIQSAAAPSPALEPQNVDGNTHSHGLLHRWRKESLRRRTRSVPAEPGIDTSSIFEDDGPEKSFSIASYARTAAPLLT